MAEIKRMAAECGLDFQEMLRAMDAAIADIKRERRDE